MRATSFLILFCLRRPETWSNNAIDPRSNIPPMFNGLTIINATNLVGNTDFKYYTYWGIVVVSPFQRLETLAMFIRRLTVNVSGILASHAAHASRNSHLYASMQHLVYAQTHNHTSLHDCVS